MKTRKFLWALLPVAAVLLMTACGGDDTDDVTPTPTPNPVTPGTENVVKSVPYTVTVNTGNVTRTTVDNDDITLRFEATDKLYVQSNDGKVYGCLTLISGANETSAMFGGTINYTGSKPATTDRLTATLVGEENLLVTTADGKVEPVTYSNDVVCASMEDAVKKYSWISGETTYGTAAFTLAQKTAFMKFNVTIQDGTGPNEEVPVKITLGTDTYDFTRTTTGSQFDAEISFVLPLAAGTEIAGDASMCVANVSEDDESILIGTGSTVTLVGGKVYPVTRTKDFVRLWADGPVWATKNVGASSVTDYGDYYAWGETTGYALSDSHVFSWANYSLCNGSNTTLNKYNNDSNNGTVDNKTELETTDDAAYVASGVSWRMPTVSDFNKLLSNTTLAWTAVSSVNGGMFKGKEESSYKGKAIFLPAAGFKGDSDSFYQGEQGFYWSLSLNTNSTKTGSRLYFDSDGANTGSSGRKNGFTVRPVRN